MKPVRLMRSFTSPLYKSGFLRFKQPCYLKQNRLANSKENRRLKPVKEINVRRKRGLIHYWFSLGYEWSIYRYISTDSTRVDNWRRRDDISDRLLKIAKFLGKGKRFFRRSLR